MHCLSDGKDIGLQQVLLQKFPQVYSWGPNLTLGNIEELAC